MKLTITTILLAALVYGCAHKEIFSKTELTIAAKSGSKINGTIEIEDSNEGLIIKAKVYGLKPNSSHGFHIHENGDCSSKDAKSAGGHFNPEKSHHGHPSHDKKHLGDLGNLKANAVGFAHKTITLKKLNMGEGKYSAKNKSIIIHAHADDFSSQPSGNAGKRIGCAVIN